MAKKAKQPKISTKKLKIIGYIDGLLSFCTIGLVFFMIISLFKPIDDSENHFDSDNNENNGKYVNQSEMCTEMELYETRGGYVGFYSSSMFLAAVGIIEIVSGWMLIHSAELEKNERVKQFELIEYWVDNAIEVLTIMTMAWFSLMAQSLMSKHCYELFVCPATQIPYLMFYLIKLVLCGFVTQEKLKYSKKGLARQNENWEAWKIVFGFRAMPEDDVESGPSEPSKTAGDKPIMTGGQGRQNRQKARREQRAKNNGRRLEEV